MKEELVAFMDDCTQRRKGLEERESTLKATHKSERRSQAIEHWIYTYPHGYGSVSISSLEHLDGYFGIPVRRVRMIRGASRTFIMVTPLRGAGDWRGWAGFPYCRCGNIGKNRQAKRAASLLTKICMMVILSIFTTYNALTTYCKCPNIRTGALPN